MGVLMDLRGRAAALGWTGTIIAAGSLVIVTSGTAYAYIRSGSGIGSGSAHVASPLTITASGATLSGTLSPGKSASLTVSVANPYLNLPLTITGVTAGTGSIQVSGGTGCTAANADVSVNASASSFSPTMVAAGATTPVTITAAVKMGTNSASGCQGATFTVPVAVTVKVG